MACTNLVILREACLTSVLFWFNMLAWPLTAQQSSNYDLTTLSQHLSMLRAV